MGTHWSPSRASLRRAVLYRAALGLLLAVFAFPWGGPFSIPGLAPADIALAMAIVVAVGLWVVLRLRRGSHLLHLALILTLGDFLAATLLVWLSGPISGPLVFLYPLAVVSTSFLLGPGASYYAAAVAFLLEGSGFLLMGSAQPEAAIRDLVLDGLSLVALAALADGLASRLRRHEIRAQRSERDVRTLTALAAEVLEQADTGLMVVDGEGRITLANPRAGRFLGGGSGEAAVALGQAAPELDRPWRAWRQGEGADHGELATAAPDPGQGSPHTIAFRFTPLGAGGEGSTLVHLYDITEARERQRQQELTERLAALGRLSANLAHEIRNPLSSIRHAGQLLAEQGASPRITDIIERESRRLDDWVETLLRHLRPPSGQAQSLLLGPVVENTVRLLGNEACTGRPDCFDWEVTPPDLTVCLDEGHLHQILWNLGINALRHGGTGGRGGAEIRCYPSRPGRVRIEVRDRGPGIPARDRERVFEPFYTTTPGGTGLGMGLVRELAEASQGTISVEDRPGGGTCVAVELPSRCGAKGETQV